MRTLAIDLGARRVGLALSDAGGQLATALQVLPVKSADAALEPVLKIMIHEGVERVVVGWPLNMDDSSGPAAENAKGWARTLQARSGKKVLLLDERLSSFEADEELSRRRRAGERLTHKKKKLRRDAVAATLLLQAFLDGRAKGVEIDA